MSTVNLTGKEKNYLLSLARKAILTKINKQELNYNKPPSEVLDQYYGVFVSLHKNHLLRGCIGYVEGIKPLYLAVSEMAVSAAFEDPRFTALEVQELDELEIEISVLSPLETITSIDQIEISRHGLVVENGLHRGLLLPQVAVKYNWNARVFIEQTCLKAGLSPEAWKEKDTTIQIFAAEIFSEADS